MTITGAAARVAAAVGAAAVLLSGCGSSPTALRRTADRLADIHSGDLTLRFSLTPAGAKEGVSVQLDGPFSLAADKPLPIARIAYAQRAGTTRRATFISTGRQAFVTTGGRTVRLSRDRLAGLRVGSGKARSVDDLGLHVDRWVKDATTSAGPRLHEQETQRIAGTLKPAQALGDLARASGGAGGLSTADAKRLSRTVSGSSVEIIAGKQDHLLRRLRLSVVLSVPPDLRSKLGTRAGLRIRFSIGIAEPNKSVHVRAPASSRRLP